MQSSQIILICFSFIVCHNEYDQTCNIFGVNGTCASDSCGEECRFGYTNDNCGYCRRGYFVLSGRNGYVNDQTGEGVTCSGIIDNLQQKKFFKLIPFFSLPWWE